MPKQRVSSFVFITLLTVVALTGCRTGRSDHALHESRPPTPEPGRTAVELLRFEVNPEALDRFIAAEESVWTAHLRRYPGFLGKEVWVHKTKNKADNKTPNDEPPWVRVTVVVYWESFAAWWAVPGHELQGVTARFDHAVGSADLYRMLDVTAHTVAATHAGSS